MAGVIWIPEAEDLTPRGSSNPMSGIGGPRATLHCTVSRPTQFLDMHRVLRDKKAEPHLLYSFADDRLGQYFPLNRAARSLGRSDGMPYSNNRVGSVNIQIEVVGSVDDWTARPDWRPGPNFRAMLAAIRSWGIYDKPIYRFAQSATDRSRVVMDRTWLTASKGGGYWWGHCHYPAPENHWDPGRVNVERFFAAAGQVAGSGGGIGSTATGGTASGGTAFQQEEDIVASIDDLKAALDTRIPAIARAVAEAVPDLVKIRFTAKDGSALGPEGQEHSLNHVLRSTFRVAEEAALRAGVSPEEIAAIVRDASRAGVTDALDGARVTVAKKEN